MKGKTQDFEKIKSVGNAIIDGLLNKEGVDGTDLKVAVDCIASQGKHMVDEVCIKNKIMYY